MKAGAISLSSSIAARLSTNELKAARVIKSHQSRDLHLKANYRQSELSYAHPNGRKTAPPAAAASQCRS